MMIADRGAAGLEEFVMTESLSLSLELSNGTENVRILRRQVVLESEIFSTSHG